jgi:ABC-2 type transport system permease protein
MAPVYVPLHLITGWVNTAASYNPVTALVEAGRGFISGQPDVVGLAYLSGLALVALGAAWALTGLRRAERGE